MIELPNRIYVGPLVYTVVCDAEEWVRHGEETDEAHGATSNDRQIIYLSPANPPSLMRAVLMHEVLHAAAFAAGFRDEDVKYKEEEWVTRVAPLVLDALRCSAGLTAYLEVDE
jgi:hypothetical protein